MINTVIIDSSKESAKICADLLSKIDGVNFINSYGSFSELKEKEDLKNISLIIFDINSKNADSVLGEIKEIKNTNFIAVSYEINPELVSLALRENAADFILKPIIKPILEASIKKVKAKEDGNFQSAKTIAVYSNKGGIGKTSLAVNLAYEIAQNTKEKTCLLDLSFNSEDACVFLNIEPKANTRYILSKLNETDEGVLLALMDRYEESNLYIFPIEDDIVSKNQYSIQTVNQIISFLKNIFSYIIIDTQGAIDENSINILNNADIVLLLALENMSSIRNCQKCYELFDNIGYNDDKIKLIVNRHIENPQITIKDIERALNRKVFSKIPNNYLTLIDAINIGQPVGKTNPNSNIARSYSNIAKEILNIDFSNLVKTKNNYGIFNLLKKMGE